MVLTDFLTETRRRWLKAFKLFKSNKSRKHRNRIAPAAPCGGSVDAAAEIDVQRFCACRSPGERGAARRSPAEPPGACPSHRSVSSGDSAYDSARSSPAPRRGHAVTYYNVRDDSSSVGTECTLLEDDADGGGGGGGCEGGGGGGGGAGEERENLINESIELELAACF